MKKKSNSRGARNKKVISPERIFRNIIGREMTSSERTYFGLKPAPRVNLRKSSKKKK